jgi:hypothetical protein
MQENDKKKNEHGLSDSKQNAEYTVVDEKKNEKQNGVHWKCSEDE